MNADIEFSKKAGANGIVVGFLLENGMVDLNKTKEIVERAFPMKVTFHRAIDVTPNPHEALESIIEAGCIRVLTSGQKNKAIDGLDTIGLLVEKAQNRIEIMAGAGLNAENVDFFIKKGVNAVHLTGKSIRQSAMIFRNSNISMSDFDQIPEFDIIHANYQKIKDVVNKINNYKN
jgi:copper homeostasis protein